MPWPFEDRVVTAFQKVSGEKARLQLYIFPDANGRDVILSKLSEVQHLFSYTNTEKEASIVLQLNAQDRVQFTVTDPRVTDHGLSRLDRDIPLDNLESVIRAARHYHWHLLRESPDFSFPNNTRFDGKVGLDFYKVMYTGTFVKSIGDPIEKVIDGQDVIVNVDADNTTWYGIELKNETNESFYPYLFFFDNSDLSIQPYFLPPFGLNNKVIPPLKPNGSLTIGYTNNDSDKVHPGGSGPFVYECRPGQDVDVGFLKLFLSNEYIDLSTLLQGVTTALDEGNIRYGGTEIAPEPTDGPGIWVSMVVTVIQERKK